MQDLINHIVEKTGISADKAQQVLAEVGNYIKEQFPMAGGMIDNFLGSPAGSATDDEQDAGNNLAGGIGSKFGL